MNTNTLLTMTSALVLSCGACVSAADIQAPPSLKGATITIKFKEGDLVAQKTLMVKELEEYSGIQYEPRGNSALISLGYSDTWTQDKLVNYFVTSVDSFDKCDETKKQMATITFTAREGNVYQGTLKGYLVCDRTAQGEKLISITITLPKQKS